MLAGCKVVALRFVNYSRFKMAASLQENRTFLSSPPYSEQAAPAQEEFAVIPGATDHDGAAFLAERCLAQIVQANIPYRFSWVADKVTVSIGHTTNYPAEGAHPKQLIKTADLALYEARAAGRNRAIGYAGGGVNNILSLFPV